MAVTPKGLAEQCFYNAVTAEEKQKSRDRRLQDFTGVLKLYKNAIQLDPTHVAAKNNLARLYKELKSLAESYFQEALALEKEQKQKEPDTQDFTKVFGLYDKAITLDPTHQGVQRNIDLLEMHIEMEYFERLFVHARTLQHDGNGYEKGSKSSNGAPNPTKAIQKYQEAMDVYSKLITKLDAELAEGRYKEYKEYIAYSNRINAIKEAAQKDKLPLNNMQVRNGHYLKGLEYESRVGINGETSYPDFIMLCKKAEVEYKKAANLGHAGGYSRLARLLYRIEGKIQESIALYEKAIAGGDVAALNELGILYEKVKIKGKIEYGKAIEYYDKAIEFGYTDAMLNRAHLYVMGLGNNGIAQYDKALELYKLADKNGNKHAEGEMDKLVEKLCDEAKSFFLENDTTVSPKEPIDCSLEQDKENDPNGIGIIYQKTMAPISSAFFLPPAKKTQPTAATFILAKGM